jgi:hypothetical protein
MSANEPSEDELKADQKRVRERQRRSELTQALEELGATLDAVDEGYIAEGNESTARVDMIRRAVVALNRLHRENGELQEVLQSFLVSDNDQR